MFQQKLADKETKYIKLDNELRTKKKEFDKLKLRMEEGAANQTKEDNIRLRVSNH